MPNKEKVKNKQRGSSLRKEPEMVYRRPEIVAKSEAKQSFVGGCPEKTYVGNICHTANARCMVGKVS